MSFFGSTAYRLHHRVYSRLQKCCRPLMVAALALSGLLPAISARAEDLHAPFDLESAAVLPGGIGNPRFKAVVTTQQDAFSGTGGGQTQPLAYLMNKPLSWNDLLTIMKQTGDNDNAKMLKGLLGSGDYGNSAGETYGQISAQAFVKVPVLAYGVNDRLTLAGVVPIVSINLSAATGFVASPQAQQVENEAMSQEPSTGRKAAQDLQDPIQYQLSKFGYRPLTSQQYTGIGDIQLLAKYKLFENSRYAMAVKGGVGLPTGHVANPDALVDAATGDGVWTAQAGVVHETKLGSNLTWVNAANYTYSFADTTVKRIPISEAEVITPDKDTVSQKLGNTTSLASGLGYSLGQTGVGASVGYNFQYQGAAQFSGSLFPQYRYQLLNEQVPGQLLHSMLLGIGYSAVSAYQRHELPIPFQINLAYSHPLYGLNTFSSDVYEVELVGFF